jgi:hypothetical protein
MNLDPVRARKKKITPEKVRYIVTIGQKKSLNVPSDPF